MNAVNYSTFRGNLRSCMRQVNADAEPLLVTAVDPQDNVVVVSQRDWDSIQETLRVYRNPYLLDKVSRGLEAVRAGNVAQHALADVGDEVLA